jgi:glycosyltransferase involved in cell wall biosynthesis
MRILQIIPSVSLVYGGPSQMVLNFSQALADQGIDVTILTTNSNGDAGQPPLDVPLNEPVKQNGYWIRYFPCAPFRRYKFSLDLLMWLNQHIHEFDLAHIHALFSPVTTAAAMLARLHHVPYILRPLGTLDPADLQKKKYLKKIYIHFLEKPNLAQAAAIHFTTQQEAEISETFGVSTKKLILPLGVHPLKIGNLSQHLKILDFQLKIPENQHPYLLFLSRIEPKKGLDLLVPALNHLIEQGIKFHLILAGSNPQDPHYEANIKAQIQASSLQNYTTITGFVSGETKSALLQNADIFVLPSYYENFGIAVAEAMVAGVPVVVSNQVYIASDIQQAQAGWVCDLTVKSLTETLKIALENAQEQKRRGLNAQNYALTHYNWEKIAKTAIQVYQKILESE